jgi:hypothetical protein
MHTIQTFLLHSIVGRVEALLCLQFLLTDPKNTYSNHLFYSFYFKFFLLENFDKLLPITILRPITGKELNK